MTHHGHPWHDVTPGDRAPEIVNGIIEIPKSSRAKYELDKPSGLLKLDRVIYSSVYYPANYGFIPQSYGKDGDPLDILVLSQIAVQPLCLLSAKVIGVMRMLDQGESDDKIIAVAEDDTSVNYMDEINQLPQSFFDEIAHFFEEYKRLERKEVVVEDFQDKKTAMAIVQEAIDDYQEKFIEKISKA